MRECAEDPGVASSPQQALLQRSPSSPSTVSPQLLGGPGRDADTALLLLLLSRFSRVRLCDPIDGSPPGSPIPGILQARILEWVAISFSSA